MKRLTTDNPQGNFETILNYVYSKEGQVYIRSDGENDDVLLTDWAQKECSNQGCNLRDMPSTEVDEAICDCAFSNPCCPIFLAYVFACQAVHLRDRLMIYENTGKLPAEIGSECT